MALTLLATLPGCARPGKVTSTPTEAVSVDRVLVLETDARGNLKCGIALYDYFDIRPDPEGTLTIEDVASEEGAARFVLNRTRDVPVGLQSGAVWVRLRVRSELAEAHAWWVFPGFWNRAEIYTPGGTGFGVFRSGASLPPPEPDARDPHLKFFHLKLLVPGGHQEMTVYLRLADRLSSDPLGSVEGSLHRELHQPAMQKPERLVDLGPGPNGELRGVGLYEASDLLVDPDGKLTISRRHHGGGRPALRAQPELLRPPGREERDGLGALPPSLRPSRGPRVVAVPPLLGCRRAVPARARRVPGLEVRRLRPAPREVGSRGQPAPVLSEAADPRRPAGDDGLPAPSGRSLPRAGPRGGSIAPARARDRDGGGPRAGPSSSRP